MAIRNLRSRGCSALIGFVCVLVAWRSADAVQRTWIGGNVDWVDGAGNNANWSGSDEPDSDDEALFNTANTVQLGSNNAVNGLTLSGGIDLFTNEFDITVDGLVQLSGAGTNLFLGGAAASINADDVTINADANLELRGGILTLDQEVGTSLLDINVGGELSGHGTITFADPLGGPTLLLINDGTLTALSRGLTILSPPPVGTLQINDSSVGGRVDLDGTTELGVVNVNRNQTLDLNVPLWDNFNGTLNLFHASTFDTVGWGLAGGSIIVNNGFVDNPIPTPDIPAGTSFISGGSLVQSGGAINVVDTDGTLQFDAPFTMNGGTFTNEGHTIFNASTTINNAATFTMGLSGSDLTVGQDALVTINQASFNLDGNAAGTVITVNSGGLLTLNLGDYDNDAVTNGFDGTVNLVSGTIDVTTSDAEFVMEGVLNSSASGSDQSLWTGEDLDIGNDAGVLDADVNITGSQPTQFGAQVDFNSDADVDVADGTSLHFLAVVNFNSVNGGNNAQFTGSGEMIFSAGVNFTEATTLNMLGGTVDLDGADSIGDTINIDSPLVINAELMRSFGKNNGGGGTNLLDINNSANTGTLTVNLDAADGEWTLNSQGTINLVNDNTEATLLAGNAVNINGTVNVTGDVRTTARVDIGSTGTINISTAGQPLRLSGGNAGPDVNTIAGGTITGVGQLGADTGKALQGFGTINAGIAFVGSANLRASGGTLTIGGPIVDVNILGTADDTGTLNVVNAWETDGGAGGSIGAVVLDGGVLQGGVITNDNANGIQGHGTVTSRVINTSKIVAANGGTLIVQTSGNDNDWDGAANTGELQALSADLEMVDTTGPVPPVRQFGGKVRAINDNLVYANGFALDFNPGSTLELEDTATYRASSSTDIGGTVQINAGSDATIQVANNFFLTFQTGSVTTMNGNLTLKNNNINIKQGAVFTNGGGALKIPDGSHVVADNLANIGVLMEVDGAFRPGNFNGIGRVDLLDYQQGNSGELYVELIGTSLNQFDRLVASGDVVLDGYLNIDIDEISPGVPFVPALGQAFNIITGNTVVGTFDYADVSGMPAGLAFHINYLANAVQLQVVNKPIFSADFDDDGDVDLTDYAIWRGAFKLNQLGDADGDNDSDGADYVMWRDQLGGKPGAGAGAGFDGAAVPEPTGALLLLMGAIALVGRRREARALRLACGPVRSLG